MTEAAPARADRIHHVANRFGHVGSSGIYDRARPAMVQQIVDSIGRSNLDVLDIGAGTGIFSRLLLPHPEIRSISAVEPVQGMRDDWQRTVVKALPADSNIRLSVIDGTFQDVPLPDACADLIVCAQAFHWAHFGGYEPAMAEFARLLRPGGSLALIWNLEDREAGAAWVGQIRDCYEAHEAGTPQYRRMLWKAALDTSARHSFFEPNETESHVHRQIPTSEQGVVDRVLSKSYINGLTPDEQDEVARAVRSIIQRGDGIAWIDQAAGSFNYPYRTDLYVFKRNSTPAAARPARGT